LIILLIYIAPVHSDMLVIF